MSVAQVGFLVAAVAAALYGLLLLPREPDWRRTLVKAAGAAALAVTARLADAPPLLGLALALSAVGDAALSRDLRHSLPGGLTALLLADIAYAALFAEIGSPGRLLHDPLRAAAAIAALAGGGGAAAWLWPRLGALRAAGVASALALAAMAAAALTLGADFWPAILGTGLYAASSTIGAVRLSPTEEGRAAALADQAAWWLYAAAQGCIAWAFLRPWAL